MTAAYADAAPAYWASGWHGVLPLPAGRKGPPPDGYTGWEGHTPSYPDVMAWAEDAGDGNIGLRLPRGVLGLDVDNYGTKRGAESLESGERLWGPLPPTWRTTSRDDGVSGIRLYAAPDGLRWPGTFGPGTETIHYGHRYVVAPPSIHPDTHKAYRWIDPHGHTSLTPPRVDDLPALPTAWVVGLTENRAAVPHTGAGMDDDAARAWLEAHNFGNHMCPPVARAAERVLDEMDDGAHESLSGLMHLVSLVGRGHEGLYPALAQLRERFVVIAGRRRDGGERTAASEWTRSLFGAVDKIVGAGELPEVVAGDPCDVGVVEPQGAGSKEAAEADIASYDAFMADELSTAEDEAVDDEPQGETPEQARERHILGLMADMRLKQEAKRRLDAELAPPLTWLDADEFLDGPEPEAIVPHMLYRDSLTRIYGKPGCGKSFLSLDLAYSVALGREWAGEPVERTKVAYVMAEGQRVNTRRAKAWLERHGVDRAELRGWFHAVPHKVLLTEEAVGDLVDQVKAHQVGLVILDTKNAMMLGDENSASDFAVMRRAMDLIREACDVCVVLIDHTGFSDQSRARGSSAAVAGMETEVQVDNDGGSPAKVTVTVTRDKGDEDGSTWDFLLRSHPLEDGKPSAVLLPLDGEIDLPERRVEHDMVWQEQAGVAVPVELLHYEGPGSAAMPDLARFMASEAGQRANDPHGIGRSRAEATTALKEAGHARTTVWRAWSVLIERGDIDPADGVKSATGRHVWTH